MKGRIHKEMRIEVFTNSLSFSFHQIKRKWFMPIY